MRRFLGKPGPSCSRSPALQSKCHVEGLVVREPLKFPRGPCASRRQVEFVPCLDRIQDFACSARHRLPHELAGNFCSRVSDTVGEALGDLDRMRRREGEFLRTDLAERAAALASLVDRIVADAATGADALRERLAARIEDLGGAVQAEPELVAQEIVKWAARSDIHEEVARLRGHLEHLAELAAGPAPCGRKLDFLVQEMNREINTIGSKAEGRETGALVVAAKAEVERLREQIQNVE